MALTLRLSKNMKNNPISKKPRRDLLTILRRWVSQAETDLGEILRGLETILLKIVLFALLAYELVHWLS
jgi:hypothetical protein